MKKGSGESDSIYELLTKFQKLETGWVSINWSETQGKLYLTPSVISQKAR